MTDNEIIKALECCKNGQCADCPRIYTPYEIFRCKEDVISNALDLINRQKAEIEMLRKRLSLAENCIIEVDDALSRGSTNDYAEQAIEEYNNLVKEMVGDAE